MLCVSYYHSAIKEICVCRRYMYYIFILEYVCENGYRYVTFQVVWCCVYRPHCTEVEHQLGESESGSSSWVLELYVVHKAKEGIFIFLRLFVGTQCYVVGKVKRRSFLMSSIVDFC